MVEKKYYVETIVSESKTTEKRAPSVDVTTERAGSLKEARRLVRRKVCDLLSVEREYMVEHVDLSYRSAGVNYSRLSERHGYVHVTVVIRILGVDCGSGDIVRAPLWDDEGEENG